MEKEHKHIVPYESHAIILIILLLLTVVTITVTSIDLSAFTVAVALLIASVKGYIVMSNFMHLKYEKPVFRYLSYGVVVLFAIIVLITFFDYLYR